MDLVPRTCTEIPPGGQTARAQDQVSRSLSDFRSEPAYVLLGDPGAGKSTAFQAECEELGEEAVLVSARDFLTFDVNRQPEWRGRTIFIDGLDEIRAGQPDARTPLDRIRGKLDSLGRPHIRLSCREADWLGANDQKHLEKVSPNSQVKVLRLDPLAESDVDHILKANPTIDDANDFKEQARSRNLEGLLFNPQTLRLLTEAVARDGVWPESRLETFEKACQHSARDSNPEHRIPKQQSLPALAQTLDVAGRLCAIQLISGAAGYSLDLDGVDDDYLWPDDWDGESPVSWHQALSTKLFKADTGRSGRFTPVHRHIAEFLTARHLAQLIRGGLPASRVVSLIIGEDGAVVSEFRGLSAWLAAHCQGVRNDLIERDPIGVGLYGDIRNFTADEKYQLLKSLNREVHYVNSHSEAFAALASPAMEMTLRDELTDPCRDRDHQIVIDFLLGILRYGTSLPGLWPVLLEIVRDDSWWPRVTHSALRAFIDNSEGSEHIRERDNQLLQLLKDIHNGFVSDPQGKLLGMLLNVLYPEYVTPSEIWNYLTETVPRTSRGAEWLFWKVHLLKMSTDDDIIELLDQLYSRLPDIRSILYSRDILGIHADFLAQILPTQGTTLSTKQLYNWFSILEGPSMLRRNDKSSIEVRTWLEANPEIQKGMFLEGLSRNLRRDDSAPMIHVIAQHLYYSSMPPDFGLWALDRAIELSDTCSKVSEHLLQHVVYLYHNETCIEGLSRSILIERVQKKEALKSQLTALLDPPNSVTILEEFEQKEHRELEEYKAKETRERKQWISHIRSNIDALRENRADPRLLYSIAQGYFGLYQGSQSHISTQPRMPAGMHRVRRIKELLDGDEALTQIVITSLLDTVWRKDIPDVKKILESYSKSQIPWLAYPYLAGIYELYRVDSSQIIKLDDRQKRIAFTIHHYYHTADIQIENIEWHSELIISCPEIVADALIQCVQSDIRHKRENISGLYELVYDQNYKQIAHDVTLPLLRTFPVRCSQSQIRDLDYLLWSALKHADKKSFQRLIERKLSSSSMNVAQKAHWMAAGLVLAPKIYCHQLEVWVCSSGQRIRHLTKFFTPTYKIPALTDGLTPLALELLIKLIGTLFGPYTKEGGLVGLEWEASDLVGHLINRLASFPGPDASQALKELSSDESLRHWKDAIDRAWDSQRVLYRDTAYRHLDAEKILRTLSNEAPAGPADLAALVADRLEEIAVQIPASSTNDWRQYWNEDPHGQPENPKSENSCRDALLSDLKERLPEGVDAQPEGRYAYDGRADIRVSYQDFSVPVEVKKNSHRDLWSAPRSQLAAQYASDPATGGYGIYLVFWFGREHTQSSSDGTRPTTPEELQGQLQDTLTREETRKITVCVIDVSKPDRSKHGSGRQRLHAS